MEKDLEIIESYLAGTLETEQHAEVESRIANDPIFANRVHLVKETAEALKIDVEGFRKDLQEVKSELGSEKKPLQIYLKEHSYLMAAAVTLIAMVGAAYFIWLQNPPASELFAENFQVPPENLTIRADLESNALSRGLKAYNDESYSSAKEQFEEVLTADPENQAVLFYSAICHMTLSEDDQAINKFKKIIETGTGEYVTAAKWYLGLTYLKLEDLANSKVVLQDLYQSESGTYSTRAGDLLDNL